MEVPDTMNLEELFTKPYWVVDILPEQVPEYSDGQYSAVEQYYLREPQLSVLRKKFFEIILKLNCYYDISVLTDPEDEEAAELNPRPEELYGLFVGENAAKCVMVVVGSENTLIVSNEDDTYMTIYNPTEHLLGLMRHIAGAEGLFVWKP